MTEMVFAIFILGLGLLFTSSMFPIAWFKARDIFEATNTQSCTHAGINMFRRKAKINGPNDLSLPVSSFFADDWFPVDPSDPRRPFVFPTTRVHTMNLGNFLAAPSAFAATEPDDLAGGGSNMPVGDDGWRLSDQLTLAMGDSLAVANLTAPPLVSDRSYPAYTQASDRLFPPMSPRPDPMNPANASAIGLWDEQFAGRRYCWSVLHRFSRMYGPDVSVDPVDPFRTVFGTDCSVANPPPECQETESELRRTLAQPREATVYYITLKRPENARFARQEGIVGSGGGATWNNAKRMDHPRALAPAADVLLPSPWRIEASLVAVPAIGSAPIGIPSEIVVNDIVLADMLAKKTVLIDERNGQIYRITQRRETSDVASVVLTLDKEYSARDVHVPDYLPFPTQFSELHQNWLNEWEWIDRKCDALDLTDNSVTNVPECLNVLEDEPQKRYYWVFPPAVEAQRAGDGIPIFAGTPPVVAVETRQVVLRPRQ